MGSKKTTTVQNNDPWGPAQPYILEGLKQTQRVFDQNQPQLDKYAAMSFDTYGRMAPGAERGINLSQNLANKTIRGEFMGKSPGTDLLTRTMNGEYLDGNPHLQGIIDRTNESVANDVSGRFSAAGRYGSSNFADVLAKRLAENETNLRYQDYGAERQNQLGAADALNGLYSNDLDRALGATDISQGLMAGSQGLLNQTAELPWIGVGAQTGNIRQASGGYGTSTTKRKTSGGLGGVLGGLAGSALSGWAGGGFQGV